MITAGVSLSVKGPIGGKDVSRLMADQRNIGLVYQNLVSPSGSKFILSHTGGNMPIQDTEIVVGWARSAAHLIPNSTGIITNRELDEGTMAQVMKADLEQLLV